MDLDKELRLRCWIDINGEKFFGPGRAQLLNHIDQQGSISKAAKAMGMSYKKAWSMVDDMNQKGQNPYVTLHKGGNKGGGAELTETGKTILTAFNELMENLNETLRDGEEKILQLV
ncbi:MAG: ModE family transcriptional regulator [Flavobacteriia bacterium]|nr:MAG: ModE family transcriptional regulator [Flavobacteriia bacterium]